MIIAFLGKAGVGKDTAADYLCKTYDFTKIAFADPMKRFCMEVFDFSYEQLWGPSSERNKPDPRYERILKDKEVFAFEQSEYLTPRFALQTLGTEWGRNCYQHVWVDYAMRIAKELLKSPGGIEYTPQTGLRYQDAHEEFSPKVNGVVISDARFKNELSRIREQGAKVVQLIRPGVEDLAHGIVGHASETEQNSVTAQDVDVTLHVPEGIPAYHDSLDSLMETLIQYKEWK